MSQSKRGSLVEAVTGTAIGFVIALLSQLVIFPMYGVHVSIGVDIAITCWFTVISIVRSYLLRRLFNRVRAFNDQHQS